MAVGNSDETESNGIKTQVQNQEKDSSCYCLPALAVEQLGNIWTFLRLLVD
ncbi:hypothetical protein JHK85_022260 [Glycine max]|nr:hypothetical protein JHK85_022260 [Glycine max]